MHVSNKDLPKVVWNIGRISFIFETMPQVLLLLYKGVSKRSRTFIAAITQIRTFSLNLGTSNKNFETTKYSMERSFQTE